MAKNLNRLRRLANPDARRVVLRASWLAKARYAVAKIAGRYIFTRTNVQAAMTGVLAGWLVLGAIWLGHSRDVADLKGSIEEAVSDIYWAVQPINLDAYAPEGRPARIALRVPIEPLPVQEPVVFAAIPLPPANGATTPPVTRADLAPVPEAKPVRDIGAKPEAPPQDEPFQRLARAGVIDNITVRETVGRAEIVSSVQVDASPAVAPETVPTPVQEAAIAAAAPPVLQAWRQNRVPVTIPPGQPVIAVVIDDLGLSRLRTARTIDLPGPMTLSFLPYAPNVREQASTARAAGHELLVHIPMQPFDAAQDPGPRALTVDLSERETIRRLGQQLASFEGYVGINNHMGSRFTSDASAMAPVLAELGRRGLLFLDSQTSERSVAGTQAARLGLPSATRHVFLDHEVEADAIRRQLETLERIARRNGYAVAIGHPHRLTLDALEAWLPSLNEKGFALAPISHVVAMIEDERAATRLTAQRAAAD